MVRQRDLFIYLTNEMRKLKKKKKKALITPLTARTVQLDLMHYIIVLIFFSPNDKVLSVISGVGFFQYWSYINIQTIVFTYTGHFCLRLCRWHCGNLDRLGKEMLLCPGMPLKRPSITWLSLQPITFQRKTSWYFGIHYR